ncbi:MAG: SCO family protein [Frankia sp.]
MSTFLWSGHRRPASVVAAAFAVGLVTALSACSSGSGSSGGGVFHIDDAPKSSGVRGTALDQAIAKPATDLTDTAGKPYNLKTATAGKLAFVYFGYTHCPDVCPTIMADLGATLSKLTPAQQAKTSVVFVTTDPARDTGTVMRTWLSNFNASFVGLTGTWNQINGLATTLGVPLEKPATTSKGQYTVDHGAQLTAFDPDGLARDVYFPGTPVTDYIHDVPLLMRNVQ